MSEFKVIKNGLCLTLDSESKCGYYNIVLKGNKIFDIDYDNTLNSDKEIFRKYPDVEVIDANNKIILPSFINTHKNSSYSLAHSFLNENTYDNFNSNIAIRLLDKYFTSANNVNDLLNLLNLSYIKSFLNGEIFVNETSKYISSDIIRSNTLSVLHLKPELIFTVYDSYISDYCLGINKFHCIGLREEEDLNNYTLSSLKKTLQRGNKRALIEVLQTANSSDLLRNLFGKSFIKVLSDNDLLNSSILFSNPIFITNDEINMLAERKANIIICPTDALHFSRKYSDFEKFFNKPFNISLGTGILGKSVFTELKILYLTISRDNLSAEYLMRMIITNPSVQFGIYSITSSIEKNKIANFLFMDVSDVRNFLTVPELNSELVSKFILENLDEKDISDIIFKGKFIFRNYQTDNLDYTKINESNCYLVKKVNEIGRYFEFKEKHQMRERVRELSLGGTLPSTDQEQKSSESYIYSERQFDADGDFRIIGTKPNELINFDDQSESTSGDEANWIGDLSASVSKIDNFNSGIENFLDDDPDPEFVNPNKLKATSKDYSTESSKAKVPTKKLFFDDATGENKLQELETKPEITPVVTKPAAETQKEKPKTIFKKKKLRFGFEEESQSVQSQSD